MVVWAVRIVLLWGVIGVACVVAWNNRAILLPREAPAAASAPPRPVAPKPVADNTLSFRADNRGHVMLEAAINGAPVRFMVDTGASFVTLTPEDASAAGLGSADLHFTNSVSTANGQIRVAPVKLRELRLGQLVMEDVDAVVVDSPMNVSLLGMSFLKRLNGYEMRDGAMIMSW
ncbi:MAG: TIGR02281 family clan AA aspartic protease [Alphaproteobacteria bacterium]|nr:TIGR02281 family clan AA aspartic protease [Alphaproteobacteria bacterium]